MQKRCTKCGEEKPLEMFSKNKKGKYGGSSRCKECDKEYRQENIKKAKEYQQKYYNENKEIFLEKANAYRKENKDKINEYGKKYYEDFKLLFKEITTKANNLINADTL